MKQGWEIKNLGEVCEIINGFAFKSQLFKDCGDDILRISNIQNGVIDDSDIVHFSKNDYPKVDFDKYTVLPNDIVVALSGATTGKFGINNTGRKLYLNQRIAICREKTNDIHHRFLLYFLKTRSKSFLESAAGVAQPNLSTEQIKLYKIPIPPLTKQEKIVAELDCLSGIIEKKKQQLKEYDALAQSIFYEMFGNPVENEKGWEVKTLGDVCNFINGYAFKSQLFVEEGDKILRISNIQDGCVDITDAAHFDKKDYPKVDFKKYAVFPNDIVIALSGATTGKLGINKTGNTLYLNQRVAICREKNNDINHTYLLFYLMKQSASFLDTAAGVAQPNLSTEQMKTYLIGMPPLPIQQEFASKIEAIEKQKELIKQSIAETEILFNSRMDYYFN